MSREDNMFEELEEYRNMRPQEKYFYIADRVDKQLKDWDKKIKDGTINASNTNLKKLRELIVAIHHEFYNHFDKLLTTSSEYSPDGNVQLKTHWQELEKEITDLSSFINRETVSPSYKRIGERPPTKEQTSFKWDENEKKPLLWSGKPKIERVASLIDKIDNKLQREQAYDAIATFFTKISKAFSDAISRMSHKKSKDVVAHPKLEKEPDNIDNRVISYERLTSDDLSEDLLMIQAQQRKIKQLKNDIVASDNDVEIQELTSKLKREENKLAALVRSPMEQAEQLSTGSDITKQYRSNLVGQDDAAKRRPIPPPPPTKK